MFSFNLTLSSSWTGCMVCIVLHSVGIDGMKGRTGRKGVLCFPSLHTVATLAYCGHADCSQQWRPNKDSRSWPSASLAYQYHPMCPCTNATWPWWLSAWMAAMAASALPVACSCPLPCMKVKRRDVPDVVGRQAYGRIQLNIIRHPHPNTVDAIKPYYETHVRSPTTTLPPPTSLPLFFSFLLPLPHLYSLAVHFVSPLSSYYTPRCDAKTQLFLRVSIHAETHLTNTSKHTIDLFPTQRVCNKIFPTQQIFLARIQ